MSLSPRRFRFLFALPVILGLAVGAVQAAPHSHAAAALVTVAPGKILKDAKGLTLYVFAKDPPNKSTCYSTCAKYWPPALVPSGTKPPAKMSGIPGTFGVVMRTDGSQQLTYDHAPLYTFIEDKDSGDFYGQGVYASGGFWWIVVAAGK
jgi:predicted lipoprotein with Yx(FWY)xxD motif